VHVENCTINNFTQFGIDFVPTAAAASTAKLFVTNTIVRNNNGASSGGIRVKPGTNVTARGSIDDSLLANNQVGLKVEDNASITVTNTVAANNNTHGFLASGPTGASNLSIFGCTTTGHVGAGGSGIRAEGANAFARAANTMLIANANGFTTLNGGHTISFGNCFNTDPGTPTDADIPPQ
jgi:hypothetical protein